MSTCDNLRHAAARTARELADAFKAHGCAIEVVPQSPVDGQVYLAIHDPLTGYEAQLLAAALPHDPRTARSVGRSSGGGRGRCGRGIGRRRRRW